MDIEHEFVVAATIAHVCRPIDTADGLTAWWSERAVIDPAVGGVCHLSTIRTASVLVATN